MTGPAVFQPTKILSGDEWERSQYAPHRLAEDPAKQMPGGRILTGDEWDKAQSSGSFKSLTFPAMPKFAADATSRLNPNAGPADRSVPEQMGEVVRNFSAALDAAAPGVPLGGGTMQLGAILGRQVVAPSVEHPLLTAALANPVGAVIGTGMAVHTIAQYGWQKAHELGMSEEDRAKAEADPNRVSGEAAAVQAVMLGLGGLAGVHSITKVGDVGAGMMEAGAAGVKDLNLGPEFRPGYTGEVMDAAKTAELRQAVASHAEAVRQTDALKAEVARQNADRRSTTDAALRAEINQQAAIRIEELQQEEQTRLAAIRALTGVRRRPASALSLDTPAGAEVLGMTAAQKGLPETASPYPPETPLDAQWKAGHAASTEAHPEGFTMGGALTDNRIPGDYTPSRVPRTEPQAPPPAAAGPAGPGEPGYRGPSALYGRLSSDALGSEYRALIEKRTAEEPNAIAPLWTPEREAQAVEAIENRRRPDGSLSPADKRQLAYLQAAEGENYYVGRHTPESTAAERRVADMNKHIAAIEKEISARGLSPADVMQEPPRGMPGEGGALASVEGTGDLKTRGLSLHVEQTAIAKELTDYLGELPQYRSVNMADQAAKAMQLIADDPALARRVALGEVAAPHGLHPEPVLIALENKALAEGDVGTIRDLANSGLTEEATTMGQRIRALRDRDPDSPVVAIQKIDDARGGGANAKKAITDEVTDGTTHVEKQKLAGINVDTMKELIDWLRC